MRDVLERKAKELNALLEQDKEMLKVEYVKNVKNNQVMEGFALHQPGFQVSPIVYHEPSWEELSTRELCDFLKEQAWQHALPKVNETFVSAEFVKNHICPVLRSRDNLPALKEAGCTTYPYMDMVIVLMVIFDAPTGMKGVWRIKVTDEFLDKAGLTSSEAFSCALRNMEQNREILPMESLMGELLGAGSEPVEAPGMVVVTNRNREEGASSVLSQQTLLEIRDMLCSKKIAILPSSVHEVIAVPYDTEADLPLFLSMVQEVNATHVDVSDRLTDSVYVVRYEEYGAVLTKAA